LLLILLVEQVIDCLNAVTKLAKAQSFHPDFKADMSVSAEAGLVLLDRLRQGPDADANAQKCNEFEMYFCRLLDREPPQRDVVQPAAEAAPAEQTV